MNAAFPINTLAGRGHNSGARPLAERLDDAFAGDAARSGELIAAANTARIATQDDAEKVADLIALIRASEKAIDRIREEHKRPLMTDCRLIDATAGHLAGPLARARDALKAMLDGWLADNGPLAPSIATVGTRREVTFCIDDLPAVMAWLIENRAGEIAQAARTIIGKQLRSLGVEHAASAGIPGITVTIAASVQVR